MKRSSSSSSEESSKDKKKKRDRSRSRSSSSDRHKRRRNHKRKSDNPKDKKPIQKDGAEVATTQLENKPAQETQKKEQQDRKIKRHHSKSKSKSKSKSPETKIIKKGRGHMNKKLFGWRSDDYDQSNNYLKRIDQKIITQNKSFKKKDPEPQPQPINIDQSDKKKYDQRGYERKDKDFRQNDRKSDKQFIQKSKWIHDKYEDTLKDKNSQDKEKQRPRGSPVYK